MKKLTVRVNIVVQSEDENAPTTLQVYAVMSTNQNAELIARDVAAKVKDELKPYVIK